ncbi:MAG: hypothetical protein HC921_05625 [Synechococcaceae cyanobacterium SM2_3_1]|nr:hypothetical protein [Synechococcaceae cyanobacterium SM2_3_1]
MKVQDLLKNAALAVSASLLWGCSSTSPTALTSVTDQSSGVSLETVNMRGDSITVFAVTSAGDSPDADEEDGICVSVDGGCTLRAAIEQANRSGASRGSNVFIGFDPGLIGEPLLLSERLPEITADIVIAGPGADQLTISGNNQVELFRIGSGATVEIRGLTLADGTGAGSGIGILNQGILTVTDSILQGHTAGDDGAGIASSGTLILNGTQILNNVASDDGGGISISGV